MITSEQCPSAPPAFSWESILCVATCPCVLAPGMVQCVRLVLSLTTDESIYFCKLESSCHNKQTCRVCLSGQVILMQWSQGCCTFKECVLKSCPGVVRGGYLWLSQQGWSPRAGISLSNRGDCFFQPSKDRSSSDTQSVCTSILDNPSLQN